MNIDIYSLVIGGVVGLAAGFLFRLHSLKALNLKLTKIGVDLGLEGFEEKSEGVRIGDISGQAGDIAGRDIDKSSRFFRNLRQAITQSSPISGLTLTKSITLHCRSENPVFIKTLEDIQQSDDDWFPRYIDACLSHPEFQSLLSAKISEIKATGWTPVRINSVDNIREGMMYKIDCSRRPEFVASAGS